MHNHKPTTGTHVTSHTPHTLRVTLLVALALAVLAITVTPAAYARTAHTFESVLPGVPAEGPGGKVPAPGPLEEVNSLTVFAGDLYVADGLQGGGIAGLNSRVDQFAPSVSKPGEYEFLSQLTRQPVELGQDRSHGIAFGSAAGEIEMYLGQSPFYGRTGVGVFAAGLCENLECATSQTLWEGKEVPEETRPFVGVSGVVVDHSTSPGDWASGDVFVADSGVATEVIHPPAIDIFEPRAGGEEHYVEQVTGPSPSQHFAQELNEPRGLHVAVSGFNGDLVVSDETAVYLFRPEEEGVKKGKYVFVRQLALPRGGPLIRVGALAVDDGIGEIYAGGAGVDEFSPEGVFLGDITRVPREGTPSGLEGQTEEVPLGASSLAVDPVSHRVFVGNSGVVDVFGPDVVVPDVVTGGPVNLVLETDPETGFASWGVEPTGEVNPDEAGDASCWFAWGLTEAFGQEAPCSPSVLTGGSPVSVHASLTGLEPDTSYVYRLQAENAHGTNKGESFEDYRFTTPGPGLRSESVSEVSSTGASFEATVAPHDAPVEEHDLQAVTDSPTYYFFQYSTRPTIACGSEQAACVSVPSAPANVGSGTEDVQVSQHASGLSPNMTYHYRLVAMNEALPLTKPGVLSAFYGPDRTFATQGPGGPVVLPDGRAWELVSPVDKLDARIVPSGQASVDGSTFTFLTNTPTEPEPPGAGEKGIQVLSARVAPGQWSSIDINLSRGEPEGPVVIEESEYHYFSEDLGLAVIESLGPFSIPEGSHLNAHGEWERIVEASPVPSERTPYLRHNSTCSSAPASCFEPLLDSEDVTSGEKYEGNGEAAEGAAKVVAATPDASHMIISSRVPLTSIPTNGGGLYEWSADKPPAERLSLVSVLEKGEPGPTATSALSRDGSRVFFTSCGISGGSIICGSFYVRDVLRGETARLDLTEGGSPPTNGTGAFEGASADGSRAFFTDDGRLTKGAGATGSDLYVCELGPEGAGPPKCSLTDLTPVPGAGLQGAGQDAQVSHALGVSADGSYVYFLAKGVQATGATPGENLYVAHEQEGKWVTSFIASPSGLSENHCTASGCVAVVSTDGRWLAFATTKPLTGYDDRDAKTGAPDSEVYLYDAATGKLACASCNPSGARPVGPSFVPRSFHELGIRVADRPLHESGSRSLFDSGRLFFESGDALVPQDTNSNLDVYEFEPAGVGGCTGADPTFNPASGGCVGLISSGRASGESVFLEASANASDVFFSTAERLVGKDIDTSVDVYDAHECSSASPCAGEASAPQECTSAAACRAAPVPQPSVFGAPSSATFSGAGNIVGASKPKSAVKPKTAAQTRARKLARALRACKKLRRARMRVCEREARARYRPTKARKDSMKHHPAPPTSITRTGR